jgi:predicted Zn-dependent protease
VKEDSNNPALDSLLAAVGSYIEDGKLMEAATLAKRAVSSAPRSVEARISLVRVYLAQRKKKRAQAEIEEILQHWPDEPDARRLAELLLDSESPPRSGR